MIFRLILKKLSIISAVFFLPLVVFSQEYNKFSLRKELSPLKYSRYNRCEGLFLGGEYKFSPFKNPVYRFVTRLGYGLSDKNVTYGFGFGKETTQNNKSGFMFLFFNERRSNDDWIIGDLENTLAGIFLTEDFKDYFTLKGQELSYRWNFKKNLFAGGYIGYYEYESMSKKTDWALFGGDKKFRGNPAVTAGSELFYNFSVTYDNREYEFFPTTSTIFSFYLEKGNSDFDYTGLGLSFKKYQNVTFSQTFTYRFILKGRKGAFAEQHLFDLGGIGSLRGYGFKEFSGNYMSLMNLEYNFGGDILQKIPLQFIPTYESAALILFVDSGTAYMAPENESMMTSFKQLKPGSFKTNIGISISIAREIIRFDFAKRLDRGKRNFVFSGRFLQAF
jgi:hypothetical protein